MRHACIVVIGLWLMPALAVAQSGAPAETQEQYREAIRKALEEYSLGHWPEARVYFADAHALWPNARTLRGLGMASYEARNYAEAIDCLERALSHETQPLTQKLASEARKILEQAKRFVATLYIEVSPTDAAVSLDAKPYRPRTDGGVYIDPGEHQLDISARGYQSLHRLLVAEAGQPLRLHLQLSRLAIAPREPSSVSLSPEPPPRDPPNTHTPEEEPARPSESSLWNQQPLAAGLVAGLGLAGIASGWVFYAVRDGARREIWEESVIGQRDGTWNYSRSTLQRSHQFGVAAIASAASGAVLLSLAQYFWLPDDPGVPTWAWVAAGAGAAIGLTGLGLALGVKHCGAYDSSRLCQRTIADRMFAPMVAIQAVPFLTLPVMYALRPRAVPAPVQVSLAPADGGASGLQLSVAGSF